MKKLTKLITILVLFLGAFAFPVSAFASTLSLSPTSGTFNKGCDFTLSINLDTQGTQTDGTDAILLFDKNALTAKTINSGSIYPDYPGNAVDNTNGKVTVSGLASVSQAFSGSGTLATVTFTVNSAAVAGSTEVKFDFDPNDKSKTTDSNVVERSTIRDTLNSVTNGFYTIGTGACTGGTTPGASSAPASSPTIIYTGGTGAPTTPTYAGESKLPNGSLEGPVLIYSVLGVMLVIVGAIGLAFL